MVLDVRRLRFVIKAEECFVFLWFRELVLSCSSSCPTSMKCSRSVSMQLINLLLLLGGSSFVTAGWVPQFKNLIAFGDR